MSSGDRIMIIFWIIVITNICFGIFLPCVCLFRWKKVWRVLALFPLVILTLAFWVLRYKVVHDPRSHNLWPFEVLFWSVGSWVYCVVIDGLHANQVKKKERSSQDIGTDTVR